MKKLLTKRAVLLLLTQAFGILLCHASDNWQLTGRVRDAKDLEALVGVSLYDTISKAGTTTDENGRYTMPIKSGKHVLQISYIGYKTIYKEITVREANLRMDFTLEEDNSELDEVVVSKHRPDANVSEFKMSEQRITGLTMKKMPSLMGEVDVIKSIQLLPGVQSSTEGTSGFSVRGGNTDQNLVLLDDASMYNASHLMGFFSVFNNDVVNEAILLKGDIPANYGGRLSSVLDVQTKEGTAERFGAEGGIGLIASRLKLETPLFHHNTSIYVAGRRSYADLFLPLAPNEALHGTKLFFYDVNAKISQKINENNKLFLTGYLGQDRFGMSDLFNMRFGNKSGSLRWNHSFSDSTTAKLTLLASKYRFGTMVDLAPYECDVNASISDLNLKYDLTHIWNGRHKSQAGLSSVFHQYNQGEISTPQNEYMQMIDSDTLEKRKALEHGVYLSHEHKVTGRFHLKYGLRFSMFQNIGQETFYKMDDNHQCIDTLFYSKGKIFHTEWNLEPRVGAMFRIDRHSSLKAAYTRTAQYAQMASNSTGGLPFDVWFPTSPNIKPQKCDQWSLGYFRNFADNKVETSIEGYYKRITDVIDFKDDANVYGNKEIDGEVRSGNGYSFGVEFLVRKNIGKLTGWVAYTFSRTFQTVEEINFGKRYNSPFDRPHNVVIVASYDATPRLNFSANWVFLSGQPCTNPYAKYTVENTSYAIYTGHRNQSRYPNYHRMDLSSTIKLKKHKRYESDLNISIYNLYARHNTWAVIFSSGENNSIRTQQIYMFSIVPSITYNFKF